MLTEVSSKYCGILRQERVPGSYIRPVWWAALLLVVTLGFRFILCLSATREQ